MPRRYVELQESLFDAFDDTPFCDPQERRQMWAIREGLRRIDGGYSPWRSVNARKDHQCMRGHLIQAGDTYFQYETGGGWGTAWKFCAGCMAMILYFMEVEKLPPFHSTHWDLDQQKPVRLTDK